MSDLKQSYIDQQDLLYDRRVETILDLGANIGQTTALYRQAFPEALIYGFEPYPPAFQQYRQKFAGDRLVRAMALAISRAPGTTRFYVNENTVTNSCLPAARDAARWTDSPNDIENVATLDVSTTSVDDFCRREGLKEIQILKMDIQGSELFALQGATQQLSQASICLVYTEVLFVPQYEGQAFYYEIADFLSRFGYCIFDIYNEAYSDNGSLKWADALFVSPQIKSSLLSRPLQGGRSRKIEKEYENDSLRNENDCLRRENDHLKKQADKLQDDIDWLLESLKRHEQELAGVAEEKANLENVLKQIQSSASWQVLIQWRKVRNRLAPEHSWHRRVYDSLLRVFRGSD